VGPGADGRVRYVFRRRIVRWLVAAHDRCGELLWRVSGGPLERPPAHICAVVLNQIGDAVMALPTIDALSEMCPESRISVVAGQGVAALLRNRAWKAEVHGFDALWQRVVRELRPERTSWTEVWGSVRGFVALMRMLAPDAALLFQPDPIATYVVSLVGVTHTFGFVEAGAGFRLRHPVSTPPVGHQVERLFALARAFAAALGVDAPRPEPPRLDPDRTLVEQVLARLAVSGVDPARTVVVHPFASAETKNWSVDRWHAVARWLEAHGFVPVVVGGPHDAVDALGVRARIDGRMSLPELAALLGVARLFVGVDSGPAHVAAAVGCPVISVFSSVNDVHRWRPYGGWAPVSVLHHPPADRVRFPYERRRLPPGTAGNPYTDGIEVDDVIREIERLVGQATRPSRPPGPDRQHP